MYKRNSCTLAIASQRKSRERRQKPSSHYSKIKIKRGWSCDTVIDNLLTDICIFRGQNHNIHASSKGLQCITHEFVKYKGSANQQDR